jgi:uncharacterized protein involved in exopolysaccharide biosynthesis
MVDQPENFPKKIQIFPMIIRVVVVLLVVLGFIWNERRQVDPVYRATATIQVLQRMDANIIDLSDWNSDSDYRLRMLNTVVATLPNTDLMKQVIADRNLLNNETFVGGDISPASMNILARRLVSQTMASLREGTELIDVSVSSVDRDLAKNLANWVSQGSVKQHLMRRLNMNRIATGVLTNEAERLKNKLREAEVAFIDFWRRSNLFVPLEERQSIVESRIASLSQSQGILDRNLTRLETDLSLVESFGDEPSASQLKQVQNIWNSEKVRRYREMLLKEEMKREGLDLRQKESHPVVTAEKRTLEWEGDRLFESMKLQASRLEAEYQRLRIEREVVVKQLVESKREALTLSENAVEYHVLERQVEGLKTLGSSVQDRIKEINIAEGLMEDVITIIEPASGARMASPGSFRFWGSGLTGLVLALAGVYFFDSFPFRVKWKS